MSDHPSWPAELVEKGASALNEHLSSSGDWSDATPAMVEAVLSALSGDLVPREEYERLGAFADSETDRVRDALRRLDGADALAEALERYAEQIERDRREPDKMLCTVLSMRRSAASYRSSSSTETEG